MIFISSFWFLFMLPIMALAQTPVDSTAKMEPPFSAPMVVVTSFSILRDMVQQVGAEHVIAISLVGNDSDAHTFSPKPKDAENLHNAKLVIVNGLGFDNWMDRLVKSSDYKGRIVVASQSIIPLMHDGNDDPHAWQSIANAKIYVRNIRDALVSADPAHAASYLINADRYRGELNSLEEWSQLQMSKVPDEKRRAITSHDSLAYFARDYGIDLVAPLGLSTEGDVGAGVIAQLIDQIRESHIRAVFLENMADQRLMKQLVTDGNAVIGGVLYTDALSAEGGPAYDYISMFRHNVKVMAKGMMAN